MQRTPTCKMMWFNESDLDSVKDEDEKRRVIKEREVRCTHYSMGGKLKVKPL